MFDEERRRVNAWAKAFERDGYDAAQEAEREEILLIRKEKDEADERNRYVFEQMMREGQAIRRQRELESCSNVGNDRPEVLAQSLSSCNPFSGEEIVSVPESSVLRQQRENRLAAILTPDESLLSQKHALNPPVFDVCGNDGNNWIKFDIVEDHHALEFEKTVPQLAIDDIELVEQTPTCDKGGVECGPNTIACICSASLKNAAQVIEIRDCNTTDLFELD